MPVSFLRGDASPSYPPSQPPPSPASPASPASAAEQSSRPLLNPNDRETGPAARAVAARLGSLGTGSAVNAPVGPGNPGNENIAPIMPYALARGETGPDPEFQQLGEQTQVQVTNRNPRTINHGEDEEIERVPQPPPGLGRPAGPRIYVALFRGVTLRRPVRDFKWAIIVGDNPRLDKNAEYGIRYTATLFRTDQWDIYKSPMDNISTRRDLLVRISVGHVVDASALDQKLLHHVPMKPMRPDQGEEYYVKNALIMLQEEHGLKTAGIRDGTLKKWCGETWSTIMDQARAYVERKEAAQRWIEVNEGQSWRHGPNFPPDMVPTWDMFRGKEVIE